jgi:hypothetical protein
MLKNVDFAEVVKQFSPDTAKPHVVIYGAAGVITSMVVVMHCIDPITGWIVAMIMQVLLLLINIYLLISFQEYTDKMVRDPADVEKIANPMRDAERALHAVHFVEFLHLGCWWLPALFIAPALAYQFFLTKLKRVDSTSLWKDIEAFKAEAKYKLIYHIVMFFLVMFAMLKSMIGDLLAD